MTAPRKTPIPDRALPALVISVLFTLLIANHKTTMEIPKSGMPDTPETDAEHIAAAKRWCESIGKMSDGEIVCKLADLMAGKAEAERRLARIRERVEMLACEQTRMRDPERTLVCDILANGQLLPDPKGTRYGPVPTCPQCEGRKFVVATNDGWSRCQPCQCADALRNLLDTSAVVDPSPDHLTIAVAKEQYDAAFDAVAPMEDRWDYDHGPDHMREVSESRVNVKSAAAGSEGGANERN